MRANELSDWSGQQAVELGAIPVTWIATTIGAAADVNPPASTVVAKDHQIVTFLPMAAVEELSGRVNLFDQRRFEAIKKGFTRFRDGDVLFAKITPSMENGKVAVMRDLPGGIGCGSTEFHVIRPLPGIASDFLRYFMVRSAFRQYARRNMQGAVGQQRVPANFVRDACLPLAPSNEQKRIVSKVDELFSRIDEGERALERVKKLVERQRQSVLKAAVTGELTREWREKHKGRLEPGEALLARILKARRAAWEKAELDKMKAQGQKPIDDSWQRKYREASPPDTSHLPQLPEGWAWVSLAQLSWASSYGTSQKCGYTASGPAVLRIPNIRRGRFDFEDIKSAIGHLDLDASNCLKVGDLLVVRTNGSDSLIGVGSALLSDPPFLCYFASYLIRFRLVTPDELAEWVNFCWQSHIVRKFVNEHKATSAGQYNVSQSSLMEMCLPIPPSLERGEIVDKVFQTLSKADAALVSVIKQGTLANVLRQGVLITAFAGGLVPQDPADESASVLLERIATERTRTNAVPVIRGRKLKQPA